MNECQLHVLDAPRIKTQEAAADFVAKWSDQEGKRNARIDAFLQELLQTYPDTAGAADNIWYEACTGRVDESAAHALFQALSKGNGGIFRFTEVINQA